MSPAEMQSRVPEDAPTVPCLHGEIERLDTALAAPGLFTKDAAKGTALSKERADAMRALADAEHRWLAAAEKYEAASGG